MCMIFLRSMVGPVYERCYVPNRFDVHEALSNLNEDVCFVYDTCISFHFRSVEHW